MAEEIRSLPVISGAGLTRRQRNGKSCASCRKRWPRPVIPVGVTRDGKVLRTCEDCVPELEPFTRP